MPLKPSGKGTHLVVVGDVCGAGVKVGAGHWPARPEGLGCCH